MASSATAGNSTQSDVDMSNAEFKASQGYHVTYTLVSTNLLLLKAVKQRVDTLE